MKRITLITSVIILAFSAAVSCLDTKDMESRLNNLDQRIAALEDAVGQINANALAVSKFAQENTLIVKYTQLDHGYELKLSDGTTITITDGVNAPGIVPIVNIDKDGNWIMSIDGGKTFTPIQGSINAFKETGQTPQFKIDAEGYWLMSLDGGKTYSHIMGANGQPLSATDGALVSGKSKFFNNISYNKENGVFTMTLSNGEVLSVPVLESFYIRLTGYAEKAVILLDQTLKFKAEMAEVADAFFSVPEGWHAVLTDSELQVTAPSEGTKGEYTINLVLTSVDGFILNEEYVFSLSDERYDGSSCKEFNDWKAGNEDNVLLDFSYAGYMRGEVAPPEADMLGYKVYNVTDYGAVANDGKSDRAAFLACVEAATGVKFAESNKNLTLAHKEKANAIVYFPEGEFILHTAEDNYTADGVTYSRTIQIRAGNFVLRGAGRDKTTLVMQDPNLPTDAAVLYSSPLMIDFKHNSSFTPEGSPDVTKNAKKGAFSVEVSNASTLKADSWVVLSVQNNDPAYVAEELKEGKVVAGELGADHDINKNGVKVYEYHQIKAIDGNVVTFYEPIHHDVDINYTNNTSNG